MATASSDTIQLLLQTAEKLFADEGIDHVSLRRIVQASGQRNQSVLHYHFGSREGLVSEVINLRRAWLDRQRHLAFDRLEQQGVQAMPREILAASLSPLAVAIEATPWGRSYTLVAAQATFSPQLTDSQRLLRANTSSLARARRLLGAALPHIPRVRLNERMAWAHNTMLFGLAQWCREHPSDQVAQHVLSGALQDRVLALADFVGGAMVAPVCAELREASAKSL